jgi:hypothetical protein
MDRAININDTRRNYYRNAKRQSEKVFHGEDSLLQLFVTLNKERLESRKINVWDKPALYTVTENGASGKPPSANLD